MEALIFSIYFKLCLFFSFNFKLATFQCTYSLASVIWMIFFLWHFSFKNKSINYSLIKHIYKLESDKKRCTIFMLFGCPSANFGPLLAVHLTYSMIITISFNFNQKVTRSLSMRLGQCIWPTGKWSLNYKSSSSTTMP